MSTATVKADTARIDRLKEQLRSTTPELDFERVRIMHDMYEETAGEHQQLRRAKFLAALLEQKKLYIDDNLFVGAMAGKTNAEGQPVGARILGQTCDETPGRRDLSEAIWIRPEAVYRCRPFWIVL